MTQINMDSLTFDGATLNTNGEVLVYNQDRGGFFGNLFFELWIFNNTSNMFQYHERYLSLWLQMNP